MRVRFQAVITGLAAIALGSFAPSANGAIVSVNFQGSDAAALAPADSTGVEAAGNWNNVSGTSGSSIALNDSSGAASGITLSSFSYSGLATTNGGFTDHSSPQKTLFAGGLGVNYGSAKFTLTGLSAYTSYDVLIYYSGGNSFPQDRKAKVFDSASAVTTFYAAGYNSAYTAFKQSNSTDSTTFAIGNYVRFDGLTDPTETFTYSFNSSPTQMVGFQVIGTVPEPASLGVLSLFGVAALSRRRRSVA